MTLDAPSPPRRRRSRLRTLLFLGVSVALVGVLLEGTAWVFYGLANGRVYSGSALRAERVQLLSEAVDRPVQPELAPEQAAEQRVQDMLRRESNKVVHPFLGFVMNPEDNSVTRAGGNHWDKPISDFGYFSEQLPVQPRSPGTLRIGITGGSVASIMTYSSAEVLVEELRKIPGVAHQRIDVVNLALPALKQPQQLMTLDYLLAQGAGFDVLINLDGVNDVCMPIVGHERGIHPIFPDGWNVLMTGVPSVARQRIIGEAVFLRDTRGDIAAWFEDSGLTWSVTANVLWSGVDRMLSMRVQHANVAVQGFQRPVQSFAVTGPEFVANDEITVQTFAQDLWKTCSELMHERCRARGIQYVHLLQPNQYAPGATKPLSAEERATAFDERHVVCRLVRSGYPGLRKRGAELAAAGVMFEDLTHIFDDIEASVWVDTCCHLTKRGNEMLARAVARSVEPQLVGQFAPLDLSELTALATGASPLTFAGPFESRPAQILGVGLGVARDLTHACDSFISTDPTIAQVDRWGVVRAMSPGACAIEARLGDLSVSVPVEVAFPPIAMLRQRLTRPTDPVLRVVENRVDSITLEVDPAPRGLHGWIAIGVEPYREEFGRGWSFVDLATAQRWPLPMPDEIANSVRVEVPTTALSRGRPHYFQAFYLDARKTSGGTLSTGVVVTSTE